MDGMTFSAAQTGAEPGIGERYLPKIVGLAAKIETSNEVSPHDFFRRANIISKSAACPCFTV